MKKDLATILILLLGLLTVGVPAMIITFVTMTGSQ